MKSRAHEVMAPAAPARQRIRALVMGYGNELRRDDGVGPAVARVIAGYGLPGVVAQTYHQLLPEHAAAIAAADLVIFVDASLGGALSVRQVHPSSVPPFCGHQFDPCHLLLLCDRMGSRVPEAWFIHIPGADFSLGEGLSPAAIRHMQAAVSWVLRIIRNQEHGFTQIKN